MAPVLPSVIMDIRNLPVYAERERIAATIRSKGITVLSAAPGSGKTTVIPWHLIERDAFRGRIIMLEPRRIAARTAADRIAELLGEPLGRRVGLRTRTETISSPNARIEIVTEGVLVRMLQADQALTGTDLLIFDEFHERSLNTDLSLALARDCRNLLRDDLRILIMSATLDHGALRERIPDAEIIELPGTAFPVSLLHAPPERNERLEAGMARLAARAAAESTGDILVFLPGYREMQRARDAITDRLPGLTVELLHGSMPPAEQRRIVSGGGSERRVIISTNVAETSVTIDGITAVVDSGLERRSRYNPGTGMDHLETVRISAASAAQRAGRAGRTSAGMALRYWEKSEPLIRDNPPEITTADLTELVLECLCWGNEPVSLPWITPPPASALERGLQTLEELELAVGGAVTELGRRAAAYPVHPRLGRMLGLCVDTPETSTLVAAFIAEGVPLQGDFAAQVSDMLGRPGAIPGGVMRSAERLFRIATGSSRIEIKKADISSIGASLIRAYPDRVLRRDGESRWMLPSGRAAQCRGIPAAVRHLVAVDIEGGGADANIRSYCVIAEEAFIAAISSSRSQHHSIDWDGWRAVLVTEERAGGIVLSSKRGGAAPETVLRESVLRRIRRQGMDILPWRDDDEAAERFRIRCAFFADAKQNSGRFALDALERETDVWLLPVINTAGEIITSETLIAGLKLRLGYEHLAELEATVPEYYRLPSGNRCRVDYSGPVPIISGRVQEFFGTTDTPRILGVRCRVHLLSPANRPVQITDDLRGFWERGYPEVRKELLGRYPRHHWPVDPLLAEATARAKPRGT